MRGDAKDHLDLCDARRQNIAAYTLIVIELKPFGKVYRFGQRLVWLVLHIQNPKEQSFVAIDERAVEIAREDGSAHFAIRRS